jgi:hypothetical protein
MVLMVSSGDLSVSCSRVVALRPARGRSGLELDVPILAGSAGPDNDLGGGSATELILLFEHVFE